MHSYFYHTRTVFFTTTLCIVIFVTPIYFHTAWSDNYLLPTTKQRLRASYEYTKERLEKMGILVREASAGLFVWVCVQRFLNDKTVEEDIGKSLIKFT